MLSQLKIGTKILLLTVAVTLAALLVSLLVSNYSTRKALEREAFNRLTAVREMKSQQIEDYFQTIHNQIKTFSEDQMIVDAMRAFSDSFDSFQGELTSRTDDFQEVDAALHSYYESEFLPRLGANLQSQPVLSDYWPQSRTAQLLQYLYIADNRNKTGEKHRLDAASDYTSYSAAHRKYHPVIRSYLETFGFYDIFLVDAQSGNIVYSVFKEVDYATSLLTGPYKDTNLAKAFRVALDATQNSAVSIVDFGDYAPSYNGEASFIASPIFRGNQRIGVLVFQMPVSRINDIMTNKQSWAEVGLGQSGETYIVASDFTLRNQPRFLIEDKQNYLEMLADVGTPAQMVSRISNLDSSIGLQRVETLGTRAALSGESGTSIFPDYRGVNVLSSYSPLQLEGLQWVIMSEIDEQEAFAHIRELRNRMFMLGAALIAIMAVLSYGLSRSLTRPIRALGRSAHSLAEGNLDQAIACDSGDEIGELAQNFEKMRLELQLSFGEIRRKNDELEQRVQERTADLSVALQQVQESEQRVSAIIKSIKDAVITINSRGIIQTFNDSAETIFGYKADSAIGNSVNCLMPESIAAKHDAILEKYDASRRSTVVGQTREVEGRRKNGELFPLELNVSPITVAGEPMFVGLLRDITERKAIEAREREVSVELKRARDAADAANQAKSDFLANMSHEIRTPMNAVIGLSDLCLKTDLTTKQEDYLSKIHASAVALLGIINDILDFSKIEAGKLDIEAIPFEIDEVLENLATIVLVKTQEKGLELMFNRSPEVPAVLIGDPLRLGQILINLCNNAAKFTASGSILVTIAISERRDDKVTLECSVRDSGIGMTQQQQSRLFQSFAQADTSTTRKYGGTGLGLAISKQLVEMMGGEIWVDSEPGVGSTFAFKAVLEVGDEAGKRNFEPTPDVHGLRALVVDDNATAREILDNYLQSFTFDVSLASDAQDALGVLERSDPGFDLVLLDWMMPGMSGLELATRIHSMAGLARQPKLIMASAFHGSDLTEKPGAQYIDAFLAKPVSPSHLFDTIMHVFGHKVAGTMRARRSRGDIALEALAPIQGARILLVEDNEINQQVATELLEQARFYVDVANHGEEALQKLANENYDCVLMDIQMPIMDGYTATRKIREDQRFDDLPVLAMTAGATVEDRERSLAAGMNAHLTKPIVPKELYCALLEWIPHAERVLPDLPDSGTSTQGDEHEAVPAIAGLDTAAGTARIGGSSAAYMRLLHKFAENQANVIVDLRVALEQGSFELAVRLAHTLKGVAGSIGAAELQRLGAQLESDLKTQPSANFEPLLGDTGVELTRVIEAINAESGGSESQDKPGQEPLPGDYPERIQRLTAQIEAYDGEATDTLENLIEDVGDPAVREKLKSLAILVNRYEYDDALTLITGMSA
jgi:PAS domain S-box-containing protein